jgi:hypothetical protein
VRAKAPWVVALGEQSPHALTGRIKTATGQAHDRGNPERAVPRQDLLHHRGMATAQRAKREVAPQEMIRGDGPIGGRGPDECAQHADGYIGGHMF